jgi:hypothetical protein
MSYRVISVMIMLSLTPFCGYLIAQNDNKMQQLLKKYYSKEYLHQVLAKNHFNYIPPNGVVPDSETAGDLAEIILSKVYGKDIIEKEKPFTSLLVNGYWIVYGSLPLEADTNKVVFGGVAEIVIRKGNGEVINISHGK